MLTLANAELRFRELVETHGAHSAARRLGVSRTLVQDAYQRHEPFTRELRDRVGQYLGEVGQKAKEAKATQVDEKTWFQRTKARAIDAQLQAQACRDLLDESEWLLLSPLYQGVRALLLGLDLVPALAEVLLPPPAEGPGADIQAARMRLDGLRRQSRRRERALPPDDHKRRLAHTQLRAMLASHIRRIDRGVPPRVLVKSEPWRQTMAAVCAILQADVEVRQIVLDVLDAEPPSQIFARALWRELQQVRSLTFPCPQYARDPVGFIRRVIGRNPWEGQIRIATAIVDGKFVVVVTGHKVGKTALIAWLVWWWVSVHADGRVMITNFTGQQLQNQDWFEITKAHRESGICWDCRCAGVTERPCPHSQILEGSPSDEVLKGWKSDDGNRFVIGVTAKEPTAAGGYSGAHLWVICDEFSGMPQALFDGYVTGASAKSAKFMGLGNPLGDDGPMYDIVNRPALRKNFVVLSISSEEAAETGIEGLADRDYIAVMAAADPRGKESPTFLRRCGGRYPTVEEKRAFPMAAIVRSMDPETHRIADTDGPLIVSIDPAGTKGTGDEIAIAATRGHLVIEMNTALGWEYHQYVLAVVEIAGRLLGSPREAFHVVVDADGEGSRVCQALRGYLENSMLVDRLNFSLISVYNGQDARYLRNDYNHVVDEATFALAEWMREGGAVPQDPKLEAELQFAKWSVKRRVRDNRMMDLAAVTPKDGKDGYRAVLHRSPDRMDALRLMAWARLVLGLDVRGRVDSPLSAELPSDFSPVQGLVAQAGTAFAAQGVSRQARIRQEFSSKMARIAAQKGR